MPLKRFHLLAVPIALGLIWTILLISQGQTADWIEHFGDIGTAALFAMSCIAVGRSVLKICRHRESSAGLLFLLSFTCGLSAFYLLLFMLGTAGGLHPVLLLALYCLPAFLMLPSLANVSWWKESLHISRREAVLAGIACLLYFYCFLLSLTPVTHFDALTNHLGIAAEYLVRRKIEPIPYNLHANLPPAAHMILLPMIAGRGPDSIQIFNWLTIGFVALSFRSLANEHSRLAGWLLAWIAFVLIPQVSLGFNLTWIDFLTTLFCLVSVILLFQISRDNRTSNYILLAAHLGFLLSLKYQTLIFVCLLFVGILFLQKPREWRKTLLLVIGTALFVSPYLIKNHLFTGNAVFPFGSNSQEAMQFVSVNSRRGSGVSILDFMRTYLSIFTKQPETGISFLLLAVIGWRYRSVEWDKKKPLLWIGLIAPFLHIFMSMHTENLLRWVQYSWALLCLLFGVCLSIPYDANRFVRILTALYIVFAFSICFRFNYKLTGAILVGTGRISMEQYRVISIPAFAMRQKLEDLNGRVLFIGESRGYFNVENSTIPSAYNFLYLEQYFQSSNDAESLRRSFQADGYRYLFINRNEVAGNIWKRRYYWLTQEKLQMLKELSRRSRIIAEDSISLILEL